jgi:hypothetical protein
VCQRSLQFGMLRIQSELLLARRAGCRSTRALLYFVCLQPAASARDRGFDHGIGLIAPFRLLVASPMAQATSAGFVARGGRKMAMTESMFGSSATICTAR